MKTEIYNKAAERGVPSCVWRDGQTRRLDMILDAAGDRLQGSLLVDGCGIGTYLTALSPHVNKAVGMDIEFDRVKEASQKNERLTCGAGEYLPFASDSFDIVLSHEVLEHVQDDQLAINEIIRCLNIGGRLILFCPNRGYPFETHGIYWRGKYHFGNIPLVNYLPKKLRNKLVPHVQVYQTRDLKKLLADLPVKIVSKTVIFGAYDNIIARNPVIGKLLRRFLQSLERTPLRVLGLSHFWVVEKISK